MSSLRERDGEKREEERTDRVFGSDMPTLFEPELSFMLQRQIVAAVEEKWQRSWWLFAKQKSKSSSSSPAAGVAIRMSEHAWRWRRPCSAAVCKLALKCCLSGGHERPWAAILWISFQSFLLLLLLFTSVHRRDGTQSWGLRITTAFALTCFHFIRTKDHWGCSSLWCNPALRLKAQISILVWSCCCIQTLKLPAASRALCMKAQRHTSTTRGQRTSEFKEARTEALVNRQWSHKKNVLELAIGAQADVSISMHHAWGRGGAKREHT